MTWKFHWLTRWDEIWNESFVLQWQRWLENSPSAHVFFHPSLARAWVETYMPLRDIRPCFLIAEASGQTVFLPLVLWRRNWKNAFQKLLIPLGYSDYDYHDPIIAGGGLSFDWKIFWDGATEFIKKNPPQSYDRFVIDGIRQRAIPSGVSYYDNQIWRKIENCPWIDLNKFSKPEEFLPSLKTSLRQDLRRQQRRLAELGQIAYINLDSVQAVIKELPAFLLAHTKRWPNAYKAPGFFENLVNHGTAASILRFSILRLNSKTIAWHLVLQFHDRMYSYMPAHEEQFENFSPSKVLLLKIIEDTIAQGFKVYDFLRGGESYKRQWTDKIETLWTFQMDRRHLSSRFKNAAIDNAKAYLKKIFIK